MGTTEDKQRTPPPQTASSEAEKTKRAALRAQGLDKRGDEDVPHMVLAPKVMPETPAQFAARKENDKRISRINPT